jgi:hypothetical protein
MRTWVRHLVLFTCVVALLVNVTGCKKRHHREMRVHEEQHVGPVEEQSPGEMQVE